MAKETARAATFRALSALRRRTNTDVIRGIWSTKYGEEHGAAHQIGELTAAAAEIQEESLLLVAGLMARARELEIEERLRSHDARKAVEA